MVREAIVATGQSIRTTNKPDFIFICVILKYGVMSRPALYLAFTTAIMGLLPKAAGVRQNRQLWGQPRELSITASVQSAGSSTPSSQGEG